MELIYNISNLDNVVHFFVLATPDNKVTTAPTTGRKVCGDKPSLDKDCKNACGNEPTEDCAKVSVHTKDNRYMCRRLFLLQAYRILVHQLQIWSKLFGSFPIHDNWEPDLYMYKFTCKEFFTRIYLSIYLSMHTNANFHALFIHFGQLFLSSATKYWWAMVVHHLFQLDGGIPGPFLGPTDRLPSLTVAGKYGHIRVYSSGPISM